MEHRTQVERTIGRHLEFMWGDDRVTQSELETIERELVIPRTGGGYPGIVRALR